MMKHNDEVFLKKLAIIDPNLWQIKQYLMQAEINPQVLKAVIENIVDVARLTGHGQVIISISKNKVMVEAIPRQAKQQFETAVIFKSIDETIE